MINQKKSSAIFVLRLFVVNQKQIIDGKFDFVCTSIVYWFIKAILFSKVITDKLKIHSHDKILLEKVADNWRSIVLYLLNISAWFFLVKI